MELTKPKVTLLNLLVGLTCFILAEFPKIDLAGLTIFFLLGYLVAGGCGAINCYFDRDLDGVMTRTSRRTIPAGRVKPARALEYGILLIAASLTATYLFFGVTTLAMMGAGVVFYLFIYTFWLKRATHWNVVIGGMAGTFAALAGWTATGQPLTLTPVFIGLLDFLWTPGHLWGLAIKMTPEYDKAQVPMLPVTVGIPRASQYVFYFNAATFASSFLSSLTGLTGLAYTIIVSVVGLKFLTESWRLASSPSEKQAFGTFKFSVLYLTVIMIALLVDKAAFANILNVH